MEDLSGLGAPDVWDAGCYESSPATQFVSAGFNVAVQLGTYEQDNYKQDPREEEVVLNDLPMAWSLFSFHNVAAIAAIAGAAQLLSCKILQYRFYMSSSPG